MPVARSPHDRLLEGEHSWVRSVLRAGRWETAVGFVVGVALLGCAALAAGSAVASALDGRHRADFAALTLGWGLLGSALVRLCRPPARPPASAAFVGVLAAWLAFVAASTVTYELLGTFPHVDDSLFESVAGFTTTASTVLADPERVGRGVLLWRAGTQWLGGLAGLLFVVAVLPSLGVGGLDVTSAGQRHSGRSLRSHRTTTLIRHLAGLYGAFTAAGVALYLAAGMGPFDALTYSATTISTGGFANHVGSFSHFSSTAVEWAAVGGMVLGGANMALLFRAVRGRDPRQLWRSFELRAYLAAVVVGGTIVALTTAPSGGLTHASVRHAVFHVASAVSTTGHWVGSGWGGWDTGPQVLLLSIMGVGSMSGSAGGGFRQVRALALVGYLRRELVLQLHPRAVRTVRVGRRPVSDELVGRMVGYQAQYLVVAAVGAVVLAALGSGIVTSLSAAISMLANVGPALGDLVPGSGGVLELPRPARAALLPLMLLGRLEIAPVLVGVAVAWSAARRTVTPWRRDRRTEPAAPRRRS